MRKLISSALMITMLVLTACGSTKQQLEAHRARFTEADTMRMTAQVQADCGGSPETFTLEYSYDGTQWTALVTEPAFAAGVTARIGDDSSELEYDGAILDTGNLLENGISPIASMPLVAEILREGSFDCGWTENELLAGTYLYDDATACTVWFDAGGLPVAAELTEHGITKLRCILTNTEIKDSGHETTDETHLGGNQSDGSGA